MKPKLVLNTFNLNDIKKAAIVEALKYTKGNMTFTAELLNCRRITLYRMADKYNINYWEYKEFL